MSISNRSIGNVIIAILFMLATACGGGGGSAPAQSSGTTFFNDPSIIDSGKFTNSAVGDFDGDGDEDLVVTYTGTDPDGDSDQTTNNGWSGVPIKIFLQNALGVLEDKTSTMLTAVPEIVLARHIEVADFNGDGADDIYFGNHGLEVGSVTPQNWNEQDVLLLSNGSGTFNDDAMLNNMPTINVSDVGATRKWYTHGVDSADIDNDGDIDLAINTAWAGLTILTNNGSGVFTTKTTLTQAEMWVQFIKADNNTSPDLWVGNGDVDADNAIYLNNGTGVFTTKITMPVPTLDGKIEEAHVADVNGDGREDLVIGNTNAAFTNHVIQVLINDYDTTSIFKDETSTRLPNPVVFTNNYNPKFMMRDLNNDGYKDIVIVKKLNVSPYTQETGVFINDNFVFTRVSTSTIPSFEQDINLIDLKGDTFIDVVESNTDGTRVYTANKLLTN